MTTGSMVVLLQRRRCVPWDEVGNVRCCRMGGFFSRPVEVKICEPGVTVLCKSLPPLLISRHWCRVIHLCLHFSQNTTSPFQCASVIMLTKDEKRANKNQRSKFTRRKERLFERGDDFGKLFGASVYLLVQSLPELQGIKKSSISTYSNLPVDRDWPPSRSALVCWSTRSTSSRLTVTSPLHPRPWSR
jgi:hypothetical protein